VADVVVGSSRAGGRPPDCACTEIALTKSVVSANH